jgi:hypothetical protein
MEKSSWFFTPEVKENLTTSNFLPGSTLKMLPEFTAFKKIPRLNRDITITEKIDGTNACVYVTDQGEIYAGKRTSWCTPEKDNYGFAAWVQANKDELLKLGPGRHFGEWYGRGINRNYGLTERRFALFNTNRIGHGGPSCVSFVPVLYSGLFNSDAIAAALNSLRTNGSVAVPGFLNAEGIVIYHVAAGQMFKVTLENDEKPKGIA